eukprot:258820-Rhodomonas_salina.2
MISCTPSSDDSSLLSFMCLSAPAFLGMLFCPPRSCIHAPRPSIPPPLKVDTCSCGTSSRKAEQTGDARGMPVKRMRDARNTGLGAVNLAIFDILVSCRAVLKILNVTQGLVCLEKLFDPGSDEEGHVEPGQAQ